MGDMADMLFDDIILESFEVIEQAEREGKVEMPKHKSFDDSCAYVEYAGISRETEKAILYDLGDREVWIPKSQVLDDNGEIFVIAEWLAEKKGIEGSYK